MGTHNFVVNNQKTGNDGRILILDVSINDVNFVLVNLYNANTETEVSVLNHLSSLLEKFDVTFREKNKTFKLKIRCQRGKTYCQNKSLTKLMQLKGSYDLCDIWRIRNPVMSTFTFKQ